MGRPQPTTSTTVPPTAPVAAEAATPRRTGVTNRPAYLPIADYGIIGDGRSVALVSREGSIDWWCVPRVDGDPIFGKLIDHSLGGSFSIEPVSRFSSQPRYMPNTAIHVIDFQTEQGEVSLTDFMPALTEEQKTKFPIPFREIVRRLEGISGHVAMQIRIRARPEYGARTPHVRRQSHGRYAIQWGDQAIHIGSTVPLNVEAERGVLSARVDLVPGQRVDLTVSYSEEAPAELPLLSSLDLMQRLTERFWQNWSTTCTYHGPYRDAVIRSALTLKLLSYAPSGAIAAAATTSLPEEIGGERNWDYRYCWLRDSAFTVRALLSLGHHREAHAFARWLLYSTQLTHPELQVMYTVYGESYIPEKTLDYLEGYQASRPVRIGNAAADQFQLDVYGEVIDALRLYCRNSGDLSSDARRLVAGAAEVIAQRWQEPDDGIWEARSGRRQHIHSKVMAWSGIEGAIEIAEKYDLGISTDELRKVADEIHAWILRYGYDEKLGAFTQIPGKYIEAALLVIPLVNFLPGDDPRVISTVEAIEKHLAHEELVYRYHSDDGLQGGEGSFLMCAFWMVEALAHIGRFDEAHDRFQKLLARTNSLGLLSEEIDIESGEFLGNFPQAFSHIGLINAALTLKEAEEGLLGKTSSSLSATRED